MMSESTLIYQAADGQASVVRVILNRPLRDDGFAYSFKRCLLNFGIKVLEAGGVVVQYLDGQARQQVLMGGWGRLGLEGG
ncbi:hypothetical protein [Chromobacterium sp. Panama]|uniref:hypothetical protein n=1 Tax=Chromobacterium sp. Panama TaxID=2161826 RepID=UPI0011B23F5E|nr:hypothetical protein [Chromobacterium sp. Panama]